MDKMNYKGKTYNIDKLGFLIDPDQWDENFVEGMAIGVRIAEELTKEHWDIINFIRESFVKTGKCPTVYETCRATKLGFRELKRLFPTGYLRGACKLAGISYKSCPPPDPVAAAGPHKINLLIDGKNYEVDGHGFLINPNSWDENFAEYMAAKSHADRLSERHWLIIDFLRRRFSETGGVPTVYEICEAFDIELDELESLFPDGYHRGAVKIAGLRVQ